MIEVKNLRKTFDGFVALDDLTMTVPDGAVYGLVGPNGAGKSTVIRHITGIFRPDSGKVTVGGAPVYENPAVKAGISYIPDDVFYFPSASLTDMARFYAKTYKSFDRKLYEELRQSFNLDPKSQLRRFSKGMQKQAAFLLAIASRPKVLVLDEPVDGLDPVMRRQVWGLMLQDVEQRGTTVLVSSHNLRELEDVCDHVGILHKGKMLLERTLDELQDNVVKVQVVFREGTDLPQTLNVLHRSQNGKVETVIIRGSQEQVSAALTAVNPLFFDLVPLTLEEVFVYELGGVDYEVKNVIL
ncbi:MAG: ABC transporter ATP-binding protein [Oscillospiraceae bacterium]|nr:ABC transporter ATP-binding protein [Oscillospiraceae bacterium]